MHVQAQERDEVDGEQQHDAADADGLVGEEAAQRVHIRGAALDQLAGRRVVVIGEGQPLDVIEEVVAQPAGDPFGGLRGQLPLRKVKRPSTSANSTKPSATRDQDADLLRLPEDIVHEVAQQQVGGRLGQRPDCQGHCRAQVGQPEAGRQTPEALQPVGRDGVFQIVGCR